MKNKHIVAENQLAGIALSCHLCKSTAWVTDGPIDDTITAMAEFIQGHESCATMTPKKIEVTLAKSYTYTPEQLKIHPASSQYTTWDVATDRQRAANAACYDFAQVYGRDPIRTFTLSVEEIPE